MKTAQEIANKYGVTHATVYNWVEKGLPYETRNRGMMVVKVFDDKKVAEWLKNKRNGSE